MCVCNPTIKTPFCGGPGCEWPEQQQHKKPFIPSEEIFLHQLDNGQFTNVISDGGFPPEFFFAEETDSIKIADSWATIEYTKAKLPELQKMYNNRVKNIVRVKLIALEIIPVENI